MGEESQENEGTGATDIVSVHRHDSTPGSGGEGKRPQKEDSIEATVTLAKTLRHFFPDFPEWLDALPDGRDHSRIIYDPKHLIWSGLLIFLLHLASRRQFRFERRGDAFLGNLLSLATTTEAAVADPDTLEHYLRRLPHAALSDLPAKMTSKLIRMKALDGFRLGGYFRIAIDGSGQLVFDKPHCAHCLHRTSEGGKTVYFHPVLEAKLVAENGFAISVATEFIENSSEKYDKQDCELKAFHRLVPRLRRLFPRTPICLLLDAIYANQPVFDAARDNGWKFIITFKKGSLPALHEEAMALLKLSPKNRLAVSRPGEKKQNFRWLESLPYHDHDLKAIFCEEDPGASSTGHFAWLTNIEVSKHNVERLANNGGRLRWKIENEGFNVQKNGGYALEHVFSSDPNASKNYYVLLQIAHLLHQLMVKGSLLKNFARTFGSVRNFVRRLAEEMRYIRLPALAALSPVGQIRFSSA